MRARLRVLGACAGILAFAGAHFPEAAMFWDRGRVPLSLLEGRAGLVPFSHVSADGQMLGSWYRAPAEGMPVVVYFPCRYGDLAFKPSHLFALAEEGYGLVMSGYRGFGGNPGRPSEAALYRDAAAMMDEVAVRGMAPWGHVAYGFSMGTPVAARAAIHSGASALVLEAPLTDLAGAARAATGIPLPRMPGMGFDVASPLRDIGVPVLILAGGADAVTRPELAATLAGLSPLAELVVYETAGHLGIARHGGAEDLKAFLASAARGS